MTLLFFILIVLFCFILYYTFYKKNIEHFYSPRVNLLGPSVIGLNHNDDAFYTRLYDDIEPLSFNIKNNTIVLSSYNNNNDSFNSFNNHNIRESLIYASIKQILRETKKKLNSNNTPILAHNFFNNDSNIVVKPDVFMPIISTIFSSINANATNSLFIKPITISNIDSIYNKKLNLYIIDALIDIQVYHPLDNLFNSPPKNTESNNPNNQNNNYNIINNLQLIIKFFVKQNNSDNNNAIYIHDLATINK